MHIAILSHASNFHCRKWAAALVRAGCRVTVFALGGQPIPGIETVILKPPTTGTPGHYRYIDFWLSARALRNEMTTRGIDAVLAMHLTPYGSWARWAGVGPCALAAMGADVFEYTNSPQVGYNQTKTGGWSGLKQRLLRPWYRRQVQANLAWADAVIADSQPLLTGLAMLDCPTEKTRLVRWGVEEDAFIRNETLDSQALQSLGLPPDAKLVLAPRGANLFYRADVILAAWSLLLRQYPEARQWHFVLLGNGYPASEAVVTQGKILAHEFPSVHLHLDSLPRELMPQLWQRTTAFVSLPVYDGFSAAVAEGLYAGAVPVLNEIAGNTELTDSGICAVMVAANPTANELASALADALLKPEVVLPSDWLQTNRKWVKHNASIDSEAAKVKAIFEQLKQ